MWVFPCEMGKMWCKFVGYSVPPLLRIGRIIKKWVLNPAVICLLLHIRADQIEELKKR